MPATDVISIADARAHVGLNANADATTLALFVSAASERLDELCGPIVQRTFTNELHNGGDSEIQLFNWPVASIVSITEYQMKAPVPLTQETNTVKPGAGFIVNPYSGIVYRRSAGGPFRFAVGQFNVSCTYVAGRYASTSVVASRFKLAARIMVANWWRFEKGVGNQPLGNADQGMFPTFSVPRAVLDLLAGDLRAQGIG